MVHPGYATAGHAVPTHSRPLSQRLLLEIMITLTVAAVLLIAMFSMQGDSFAVESDPLISYGISAGIEPLQGQIGSFQETVHYGTTRAVMTGDTSYSISARVQSSRTYEDEISVVMPVDFLLAWGDMAGSAASSELSWEQANRRGTVSGTLGGSDGLDMNAEYVISHVSNNHLVPANDSIREGLAQVQAGDFIRLEGKLVDLKVFVNEGKALTVNTSKTRTDQGDGACEVIFVESLKVNGKSW